MKNTRVLKELAQSLSEQKALNKSVVKNILLLDKSSLKILLFYYKAELNRKKLLITTVSILTRDARSALGSAFPGKDIEIILDKSQGGGIKIQEDDNITDFTFRKHVNDIIDELN